MLAARRVNHIFGDEKGKLWQFCFHQLFLSTFWALGRMVFPVWMGSFDKFWPMNC